MTASAAEVAALETLLPANTNRQLPEAVALTVVVTAPVAELATVLTFQGLPRAVPRP